jgi:hypothetical protein
MKPDVPIALSAGITQSGRFTQVVLRTVRCGDVGRRHDERASLGDRTPPQSVERRDPAMPPYIRLHQSSSVHIPAEPRRRSLDWSSWASRNRREARKSLEDLVPNATYHRGLARLTPQPKHPFITDHTDGTDGDWLIRAIRGGWIALGFSISFQAARILTYSSTEGSDLSRIHALGWSGLSTRRVERVARIFCTERSSCFRLWHGDATPSSRFRRANATGASRLLEICRRGGGS